MKSIKTKIIIYFVLILVFVSSCLLLASDISSSKSMKQLQSDLLNKNLKSGVKSAHIYLNNAYGKLEYVNGSLIGKQKMSIQGDTTMVDQLAKDLGVVSTIFIKSGDDFKRISTNVLNEKGQRAIGTFLGKDSAAYSLVSKGIPYNGKAKILGTEHITSYEPIISDSGEIIGLVFVGISAKESSDQINTYLMDMKKSNQGLSIVFILCSIIITYFIGNSIAKPIILVMGYSKKIANLDISEDIPPKLLKRKDEIGLLAKAFYDITHSLRDFSNQVMEASKEVLVSSQELNATSHQVSNASEEVARTIEQIAAGANDQAKDTDKGASFIDDLGNIIEIDQRHIKELNYSANKVNLLKDEGLEIVKDLIEKTINNNVASTKVREIIYETNDSSARIKTAGDMIKCISDKTNLLALNAAIEAARAGEAGKGFAVVADEIRKLADASNGFTKQIDSIVKELIGKTELAVNTMENVQVIVDSQSLSVENTYQKFEGIANALDNIKDIVVRLNCSGNEMENKKGGIIEIMQNLSALSQENAAGTQEASASVEEQTASMAQVAAASENLSKLAKELEVSVSRFKC